MVQNDRSPVTEVNTDFDTATAPKGDITGCIKSHHLFFQIAF